MGPQLWQLSTLQIQQSGVILTIREYTRTIMTIINEHLPLPHNITENMLKFNGLSGVKKYPPVGQQNLRYYKG